MFDHINRLVLPLIVSNVVHMVAIKRDWFPSLARPISTPLFGGNKTWRGFVLVPMLNALALPLFSWGEPIAESMLLGAALGFAYMLFELPNSWIKRRAGIGAGESAERNRYIFMIVDKTDSAFGVTLAYYLLTDITISQATILFFVSSMVHILFSFLLVSLRIKRSF